MESFIDIESLKVYIEIVAQGLLGIVVIASAAARVIDDGKHEVAVGSMRDKVLKAIQVLPTIGVNPRTKHLEAQLEEMKTKLGNG